MELGLPYLAIVGRELPGADAGDGIVGERTQRHAPVARGQSGEVRELGARGFDVDVIDTSGGVTNLPAWKIRASRLARFLRVAWGAARKIWRSDIVFLIVGFRSALCSASLLWAVCKIARRPLALRISGGEMMEEYLGYGALAARPGLYALFAGVRGDPASAP